MKFHEWGEQYGPIYQVNLAGVNHVWICRDNVARELLTKRGAIYSDRPHIPALERDNRTSGQYLPLMSRNDLWTRQRRFAKQIMDTSEKSSFYGYPELESVRLLVELMTNPTQYNVAMESYIARVTSRLAWGTSASSDELKQRARELLVGVSPNGALGNKLPFITSLSEKLMPAVAWESRRSRTERKFFQTMQQYVRSDMDDPVQDKPSWTRMYLENKLRWGFASDLEGAFAVGMHGIAGALTIAAPMQSFCLAMCHYPQYKSFLYQEIDSVLGDRMPTSGDMPDMPVLRAFIRETLRWRPPVPTGIPHESTEDDVYGGYLIPAGSVMHPLEWSISRDPEVFPEPDEWNPLRWLDEDYPTYQEPLAEYPTISQYSQFGYGRRTCQGMGVTEADLFVGLGSVAWLFSMQASKDAPTVPSEQGPSEAELEAESWLQEETELANERAEAEQMSEAEADAQSWLRVEDQSAHERADFESKAPEAVQERKDSQQSKMVEESEPTARGFLSEADAERSFFEQNATRIKRESWERRRPTSQDLSDLQGAIAAKLAEDEKPEPAAPPRPRSQPPARNTAARIAALEQAEQKLNARRPMSQAPAKLSDYDKAEQAVTQMPPRLPWLHTNDSGISLSADHENLPRPQQTVVAVTPPTSPRLANAPDWPLVSMEISPKSGPAQPSVVEPASEPAPADHPPQQAVSIAPQPEKTAKLPKPSTAPIHGKVAYENDPTMDFSTLLIAKPLPFKFDLSIRNRKRAAKVHRKWLELKMQGEFEEAKCYWGKTHAGNQEFGWGETIV